jgi:hypothetical protein
MTAWSISEVTRRLHSARHKAEGVTTLQRRTVVTLSGSLDLLQFARVEVARRRAGEPAQRSSDGRVRADT